MRSAFVAMIVAVAAADTTEVDVSIVWDQTVYAMKATAEWMIDPTMSTSIADDVWEDAVEMLDASDGEVSIQEVRDCYLAAGVSNAQIEAAGDFFKIMFF